MMDANFIASVGRSTQNVFSTMLSQSVEISAPVATQKIAAHFPTDCSAVISLTGDIIGSVIICLPMETAKGIVKAFTGSESDEPGEDFADAVGELLNMITGSAKTQLEDKMVTISCPSVVIGPNHSFAQLSDSICVSIPCQCDLGSFAVEVAFKKPAQAAA